MWNQPKTSEHAIRNTRNVRFKISILTGEMDFGRMDNQTRPARISVTERARVNMSALDCELFTGEIELMMSTPKSQQFWVFACTGIPGGVGDGGNS